jgi:hypothetical protein
MFSPFVQEIEEAKKKEAEAAAAKAKAEADAKAAADKSTSTEAEDVSIGGATLLYSAPFSSIMPSYSNKHSHNTPPTSPPPFSYPRTMTCKVGLEKNTIEQINYHSKHYKYYRRGSFVEWG